ncbi:MAG: 4Fe-4S binding protein [Candidatus Margulisbacteria bacterium]|jgi:formate hydrogenlyase subunit 6/NADH:ubiquinone oxidoreductase subunit I|nr:4Fe-4S binding protein [Candidatus Margulisiibacteriota bacterium]
MRIPLPKIREVIEAVGSLFSRPFTNGYPFKPLVPPDGFRGKPEYYQDECVGCLACYEVCPGRAISYEDNKETKKRTLTYRADLCIFCQQCEKACITEKGIQLTKQFELASYERKGVTSTSIKELVLCENCGEVVGCIDHLRFLARKVGPLLYTNPTLLLARHDELKLLEKERGANSPHPRAGHLKLLCPNCRREMIVKEQW